MPCPYRKSIDIRWTSDIVIVCVCVCLCGYVSMACICHGHPGNILVLILSWYLVGQFFEAPVFTAQGFYAGFVWEYEAHTSSDGLKLEEGERFAKRDARGNDACSACRRSLL